MKIIMDEKELKALFDGLARVLRALYGSPEPSGGSEQETPPRAGLRRLLRSLIRRGDAQGVPESGAGGFDPGLERMKEMMSRYQGRRAELTTQAGLVAGEIATVGGDYVKIAESGGSYVLIPLEQIVSFHLPGKQVMER
ncbi:hypothetical protein [Paenibacillus methanolicus]|uniref:DUF2642 domain-containing protein n=1 Tax=Paenibacillus methanolicus TaxID=582686 RepID=A0A5S5C3Q0_9BACL|nr:hypothetical protein [Paenibacillus methanolicus]TYP73954.1 Protein of unknown function (DUF2642) [Paenibacillus methanolicus]